MCLVSVYIQQIQVKCIKHNYWGWGLAAWPLHHVHVVVASYLTVIRAFVSSSSITFHAGFVSASRAGPTVSRRCYLELVWRWLLSSSLSLSLSLSRSLSLSLSLTMAKRSIRWYSTMKSRCEICAFMRMANSCLYVCLLFVLFTAHEDVNLFAIRWSLEELPAAAAAPIDKSRCCVWVY